MRNVRWVILLALVAVMGCASKPPKNAVTVSMHLAASPSLPEARRQQIALRMPSISFQVDRVPVLTERDLEKAEIEGKGDGYGMRFEFNTSGTIHLDTVTTDNRGTIMAVFLNGVPVAAPMIKERIVDGYFSFTPDLSYEEAEKLVDGINASIEYLKKKPY